MDFQARDAYIVSAVRTPVGRYGGALAAVRPDDLLALVIREAVALAGVAPAAIDDVIAGCANQAGEDNRNVARMSALLAGLPVEIPGQTVNRLCGSGLQAVVSAYHAIRASEGDWMVAGGVESMSRAPYVMLKPASGYPRGDQTLADSTIGWRFVNPALAAEYPPCSMGETAENVAERWSVSRAEQDAFALESQRRAAAAHLAGRFREETVPVQVSQPSGERLTVEVDEHPRPHTTGDGLAKLAPAFRPGGSVTAGNASGINDGAAALVLASGEAIAAGARTPIARIVSAAVAGVDPAVMGVGPVPAARKALERAGLRANDLDVVELNEAFASQAIACIRELGLDPAKVNPNGGSIALGHPLGSTGARLMTTLVHELQRRQGRYGMVAMCIGVGQGIACIVERVA
jgi:3-oxoadipyl-CoA thiolase